MPSTKRKLQIRGKLNRLASAKCRKINDLFKSQNIRIFSTGLLSLRMSSSLEQFNKAKEKLNTLSGDVGNDDKLKIYAFFKQATVGPCNVAKPSAFDFVGKAKWDAWNSIGNLSKDDAMEQYVSLVNELAPSPTSPATGVTTEKMNKYEGLTFVIENNITKITLCRPQKKNAITTQMYKDLALALKEAGDNDTALTVLTGEGDYFCSGNDLNNFLSVQGDLSVVAKESGELLKSYVAAYIDFPKPLVAAVNGPAMGIAVTCLGLCDIVYASDKAVFNTPFSVLGQTPEGCASYTFPKIMGYSTANEVLLFNKKLTAVEAQECGLVTEVFPDSTFKDDVAKRVIHAATASKYSLMYSKQLVRDVEREMLHKVNAAECARLVERWQSADCMEAIMNFFQKKSKM